MPTRINSELLTDAPFNGRNSELFFFESADVDSLVYDILKGQPTCYLVSGYRGAGKSSFINKVKRVVEEHQRELLMERINYEESELLKLQAYKVFTHTNFAKYEDETNLLRKLIRGLYQGIDNEPKLIEYIEKHDHSKSRLDQKILPRLKILYERTFNEIVNSQSNVKEHKREIELKVDLKKLIITAAKGLSSLALTIACVLNIVFKWFDISDLIHYILLVSGFFVTVSSVFELKYTLSKSDSKKREFNRKTLYDNEIADYHFNNVISDLKKLRVEFVFVLDELDKVDEDEVDKLIKDMKPHLVSGMASYIVVAGQSLYYKYHFAKSEDDAVLSSLFSRIIHVPLLTPLQLLNQFRIIAGITNNESIPNELRLYVDYLIFKSKRVPRRFINLIRQNIVWEEETANLHFENQVSDFGSRYSSVLNIIDDIYNKEIIGRYDDPAIRDFLFMQLFIKSEKLLSMDKQKISINI